MNSINDFDKRLRAILTLSNEYTEGMANAIIDGGEWGNMSAVDGAVESICELQLIFLWWALLEWKAYDQNTFFVDICSGECPKWEYPSTLACKEMVQCMVEHFDCRHVNIKPLLEKMGVLPFDQKPDGINYMHILEGYPPCDDNRFQVEKPRGEDFV